MPTMPTTPTTPTTLLQQILLDGQMPQHVAIIMDGNGRWAQARGRRREWGHREGARAVRRVVEASPGDENDVAPDGSRSRMDVSRLRDDIGFTAEHDLSAGLTAFLQWRDDTGFRD